MNVPKTDIDDRGWSFTWGKQALNLGRNGSLNGWTADGRPLIYVSPLSDPKKRLRGGMPVCWPWFGAAPQAGLPPHGFLLDRALKLKEESADNATMEAVIGDTIATCVGFAGQANVSVRYSLSAATELAVTVTISNPAASPIRYDVGLHPYLVLPRACTALRIVNGSQTVDVPDAIDQRFTNAAGSIAVLEGDTPLWTLETSGLGGFGLWRIDAAKAATIPDLPDDDFSRFISVNPIALGETAAGGETKSYTLRLKPAF